MQCICFPFYYIFTREHTERTKERTENILNTIIELEKTILQLERYACVVKCVREDLKDSIFSPTMTKGKKIALLRRQKMLLLRESDILAQKERLFSLLVAIQQSLHIEAMMTATELANAELKRLHIDNIESTINQMDDLLISIESQSALFAPTIDEQVEEELERELSALAALAVGTESHTGQVLPPKSGKDISLPFPPCPNRSLEQIEQNTRKIQSLV